MLFISGAATEPEAFQAFLGFNLVIEMLFISGARRCRVRCGLRSFNLVIEMLFISGSARPQWTDWLRLVSISSSRCFSFQDACHRYHTAVPDGFNLVIEMLFISGHTRRRVPRRKQVGFNLVIEMLFISGAPISLVNAIKTCFNLAIEMLFISGDIMLIIAHETGWSVSISQSRCFSYQDTVRLQPSRPREGGFQSRNREAFHIRVAEQQLAVLETVRVSISQSRCFSFQVTRRRQMTLVTIPLFQSRNRDAFHFR